MSELTLDRDTADLLRNLSGRGWTSPDFAANHLAYAAALALGEAPDGVADAFDRYWTTVARITGLLQREGIFHVILKTRRNYPYADTNVDVFIDRSDWPVVREVLCAAEWRMPSAGVRFKQSLIERDKIKLPPRSDGFVPAHMYKAVSWRYQREVSFLDPDRVEWVPLRTEAPGLGAEDGSLAVPMPSREADILLHCAEIVFENYRLALGEALYLRWLLERVPARKRRRVYRLGIDRGAAGALRCILRRVDALGSGAEVDPDWPRPLSRDELLASWGDRFRTQWSRKARTAAVEEWVGYAAFATMYGIKRSWFG